MRTTIKVVEEEVLKYYGITAGEMFNKGRDGVLAEKRFIFYYLSEMYTANSMDKIGKYAGKLRGKQFDHATVLHGKNKITDIMSYDKRLLREVQEIIANIRVNPNTIYTENSLLFKTELDQIIANQKDILERVELLERMYVNALEVV